MAKRRGQHGQARREESAPKDEAPKAPVVDASDPAAAELTRAQTALARGDVRAARQAARAVLAGSPSAAAGAESRRVLDNTALDKVSLLAAAVVLATILSAAWAALLSRH
jgi:hypothetical protein